MRCLGMEFYRIFGNKKIWLISVLMLVLNIVLMLVSCATDDIIPAEYKNTAEIMRSNPADISEAYSMDPENPVYKRICEEYEAAESHEEYVQSVLEKADSNNVISIFQNEFSKNNGKKTRDDYSILEKLNVTAAYGYGMEKAVAFMGSSVVMIFVILILTVSVVIRDKKNGMLELVRATRYGGARDAVCKMCASMVYVALMAVIVAVSDIVVGGYMYGWCSMSEPVQSLYAFAHIGGTETIGSFLTDAVLYKTLVYVVVALLAMVLASLAGNEIILYLMMAVFTGIELSKELYGRLSGNNSFVTRTGVFYGLNIEKSFQYYNYDIFGHPVQMQLANVIVYAVVVCILICAYMAIAENVNIGYRENIRLASKRVNKRKYRGLFSLESYKFFVGYKGLVILLVFVSLQCYVYFSKSAGWDMDAIYYRNYLKTIEGEVAQDKVDYINSEVARMEQLNLEQEQLEDKLYSKEITVGAYDTRIEEIAKALRAENAAYRCKNYVDYIVAGGESGTGFVYERGWNIIFDLNDDPNEAKNAILSLVMVILAVSFLYSEDYQQGMKSMIDSSAGKKKSALSKAVLSAIMIAASFVIVYAPEFVWACTEYGLSGDAFSIHSIMGLAGVDKYISLSAYMVLKYVIKFAVLSVVGVITGVISGVIRNTNVSIIIASILFISPLLLNLLGIDALNVVSVTNIVNMIVGQ